MARKLYLVVFVVFVLRGTALTEDKIRFSITSAAITTVLPLWVAQKNGFFKQEGLEAEIIRTNANVGMAALLSGSIDYVTLFSSVVRAAIQGVPVRVVSATVDKPNQTIISRAGFKTVKDLKGKRIAIGSYGDQTDLVTRMVFKHFEMDPDKDLTVIPAGDQRSRLAMLQSSLVEGAVVDPYGLEKLGFNVVARAYELFTFPSSGLGVNLRKIKGNPDVIKRTIKAMIRAVHSIRTNREGAIQLWLASTKSDRESAAAGIDSFAARLSENGNISESGLKMLIEEIRKMVKVEREITLDDVADYAMLRQAQKELGIENR
ncbi:MAG TPA: ABC transporter substrate-binding protein [Candidatus Binatia bacterium]|jgi:NitT/TauT family transport system substrate-binding protein